MPRYQKAGYCGYKGGFVGEPILAFGPYCRPFHFRGYFMAESFVQRIDSCLHGGGRGIPFISDVDTNL